MGVLRGFELLDPGFFKDISLFRIYFILNGTKNKFFETLRSLQVLNQ